LVVTLVITTLVAVIIGLTVVSPGLGCHPASAVDGLNATAPATTRDALRMLAHSNK
jgi:aconitase B